MGDHQSKAKTFLKPFLYNRKSLPESHSPFPLYSPRFLAGNCAYIFGGKVDIYQNSIQTLAFKKEQSKFSNLAMIIYCIIGSLSNTVYFLK